MLRKQLQSDSTPPPAYGSPFTLPTTRRHAQASILGSPMTNTFQMVGWDVLRETDQDLDSNQLPSPPPEGEDGEWMNEKSREELKDLLVKADGIIKERENGLFEYSLRPYVWLIYFFCIRIELGITSAVARGLYQNNVTLQSRHQALLSRLPIPPIPSTSSPDVLQRTDSENSDFSSSPSDSALGLDKSPKPSFYRGHARKASVVTADISLLADQNAELLDKLEKLEAESTSADHAGRRELRRLEKEITYLRESLEKTQMKSEELEEKVQEAVVGDVWRRKKEREAKFRAMRNLGRDQENEDTVIRDFAPGGSMFGGPTEAFSFFPAAGSSNLQRKGSSASSNMEMADPGGVTQSEHSLIAQLLRKVQELEQTNARILEQQTETANQLTAVQRDTAHIAKVYETLADPDSSLELDGNDELDSGHVNLNRSVSKRESRLASSQASKFRGMKRDVDLEDTFKLGTCVVYPELPPTGGKNRKTVMGLFDERRADETVQLQGTSSAYPEDMAPPTDSQHSLNSWNDSLGRSSWSSIPGGIISPPRSLSPLHFFSPASQIHSELSPLSSRPTLQSELNRLGDDWGVDLNTDNKSNRPHNHLRTSSLYDLSQISVPPSPSPLSRGGTRISDEMEFESSTTPRDETIPFLSRTPLLMSTNTLKLSVEPPTPDKAGLFRESHSTAINTSYDDPLNARSPRIKMMSDTLRSRSSRWVERRNLAQPTRSRGWDAHNNDDGHKEEEEEVDEQKTPSAAPAVPSTLIEMPTRLSNALDNIMDDFQGFSVFDGLVDTKGKVKAHDNTRPDSPPAALLSSPPSPSQEDQEVSIVGSYSASDIGDYDTSSSPQKARTSRSQDGILLQVWLWLQFAILMLVFVYAMAKRGPSAALSGGGDSGRSGAVVRRR